MSLISSDVGNSHPLFYFPHNKVLNHGHRCFGLRQFCRVDIFGGIIEWRVLENGIQPLNSADAYLANRRGGKMHSSVNNKPPQA